MGAHGGFRAPLAQYRAYWNWGQRLGGASGCRGVRLCRHVAPGAVRGQYRSPCDRGWPGWVGPARDLDRAGLQILHDGRDPAERPEGACMADCRRRPPSGHAFFGRHSTPAAPPTEDALAVTEYIT